MAAEKCYREIQSPGELFGISFVEIMVLIAVPLLLAPFFTLIKINLIYALAIDALLYALVRFSNRLSGFEYGVISALCYHFVWPRQLSGYVLDEHDYIRATSPKADDRQP